LLRVRGDGAMPAMFDWMPRRDPMTTALSVAALGWWLVVLPWLASFSPGKPAHGA
jgi:hypothetical protein